MAGVGRRAGPEVAKRSCQHPPVLPSGLPAASGLTPFGWLAIVVLEFTEGGHCGRHRGTKFTVLKQSWRSGF